MNTPACTSRVFWVVFAVCVAPPLIALGAFMTGPDFDDPAFLVGVLAAFLALILYAAALVASGVAFIRGRREEALSIVAGLIASLIVGPGLCFGFLGTL